MVFNSLTFLVFFLCVLVLHTLPFSWPAKKRHLLVASYVFYAAWNPPYVLLLLTSTLVDWVAARRIADSDRGVVRRALLTASLSVNLGLLATFKYADFLLESFSELMGAVGIDFRPAAPGLVLPVGISFYTFQSISYTVDAYRGRMRPWHSFTDFALYVSFFPQLVAGPIVRSGQFLPQCVSERRASPRALGWGLTLLVVGLFQKNVLADSLLAPVADRVYADPETVGAASGWLGTLAFSGQIFCDFSGYSNCAIATALCLGFALPDNFRSPYAALGFRDFWRRWHISLSTWLRDYVYVSLGGNRRGAVRTHVNVLVTMLLGGLWHGASWNFVVWGGLHGLLLSAERLLERRGGPSLWTGRVARLAGGAATFLVVTLLWIPFRAPDFAGAAGLASAMIGIRTGVSVVTSFDAAIVLPVVLGLFAVHWRLRDARLEDAVARLPAWLLALALAALLIALLLTPGEDRAFIYFQF